MIVSGLYPADIVHAREKPVVHCLRYRALYMLLDLDEVPNLARRLRLFSYNRLNLVSWRERDHGDGSARPLRDQIDEHLNRAGIGAGGAIRVLCMPRVLGLVFNPLSIFFCHRLDGRLAAVLYEVNNTFGQRHAYLIPVAFGDDDHDVLHQTCTKNFYVSPFLPMALTYHFRLREPDETLAVRITVEDAGGTVLKAVLGGGRQALSDRHLLRAFLRTPLLAWQVLGAIHWEALKLWRKGLRIQRRPNPPDVPVSLAGDVLP